MTKIKSRTKTIRELLANTKYYLDYYQREYVWQSENVTDFRSLNLPIRNNGGINYVLTVVCLF